MPNSEPYLFEDVQLPDGFIFPDSYIDALKTFDDKTIPWWFLAKDPKFAKFSFEVINGIKKSFKVLVPFAKHRDDEDGVDACFDGECTTGNPRVYFAIGTEKRMDDIDWKTRYSMENFDAWLKSAKEGW